MERRLYLNKGKEKRYKRKMAPDIAKRERETSDRKREREWDRQADRQTEKLISREDYTIIKGRWKEIRERWNQK
jgi:hypothetical protein